MAKATLRGFRRMSRARSRGPAPWPAVCLRARSLLENDGAAQGGFEAAAALLLQLDTDCRPGALLRPDGPSRFLKQWATVIKPLDEKGATEMDRQGDTVVLDAPVANRSRVNCIVSALRVRARRPRRALFRLALPQYAKPSRQALSGCALSSLKITLHSFRHGGPSTDVLRGRRFDDVQCSARLGGRFRPCCATKSMTGC